MDKFREEEKQMYDEFGMPGGNMKTSPPKKKDSSGWKWALFFTFIFLGFSIGLALGVYYGVVTTFSVIQDLTENTTIVIDFDESKAIDYMQVIVEERYAEALTAAALGDGIEDLNLTEDEDEQLKKILEGVDPELVEQMMELDTETLDVLAEAKTNPEAKGLSQTLHNFRVAE